MKSTVEDRSDNYSKLMVDVERLLAQVTSISESTSDHKRIVEALKHQVDMLKVSLE